METKIFPEQDYEIIGLEDHIACIYEKDEVYWWKNCSDIVTDVERGIYTVSYTHLRAHET